MIDQEPADPRALADSLVDALLEEHLGGAAPPGRERAPREHRRPERRPLAAAAVLLIGTAVVVGTVLLQRGGERAAAAPQGQGDDKHRPNVASAFFPLQVGSVWEYRDLTGERATVHTVRACVAVPVGDDLIVQVADCSDGDAAFTFWSSDARGIRRHASLGTRDDPLFVAAGVAGLELPSPIGAQATWPVERVPERSRPGAGALGGVGVGPGAGAGPRGVGGPAGAAPGADGRPAPDGRPAAAGAAGGAGGRGGGGMFGRAGARPQPTAPEHGTATLLGLDEELRLGEQTFRCAHVRIAFDGTPGLVEESWYARGVGLVRRTSRSGDGPETVRELVRYAPAQPLPARDTLLAASVGDAAKTAKWIDLPADEETAWTLRASFAVIATGDTPHTYALVDDQVFPIAAEQVDGYQRLAQREDFTARMHGLFPQRVTHGLCRLAVRMQAAELGCEVVPGERSGSIRVNADSCSGQVRMKLRSIHGAEQAMEGHVELHGTEPSDVRLGEPAAGGR